ncbi:hypothetical protein [Granulicella aggregans]
MRSKALASTWKRRRRLEVAVVMKKVPGRAVRVGIAMMSGNSVTQALRRW